MVNSSKFRTDQENDLFKNVFNKCKKSFEQTLSALDELNEIKSEIQEYESKVHTLSGKNYPKNIEKVKQALTGLKQ